MVDVGRLRALLDRVEVELVALRRLAANLLMHGYATIDDDRVIAILRSRLDDLTAFRRRIGTYTS